MKKKQCVLPQKKTKTGELFRNMVRRQDTLISKRDRQSVVAARGGLALRVRGDLLPAGDGGAWMFS